MARKPKKPNPRRSQAVSAKKHAQLEREREHKRRSLAAKRGWKAKRKREQEEHASRSLAAKRGWENKRKREQEKAQDAIDRALEKERLRGIREKAAQKAAVTRREKKLLAKANTLTELLVKLGAYKDTLPDGSIVYEWRVPVSNRTADDTLLAMEVTLREACSTFTGNGWFQLKWAFRARKNELVNPKEYTRMLGVNQKDTWPIIIQRASEVFARMSKIFSDTLAAVKGSQFVYFAAKFTFGTKPIVGPTIKE